MDANSIFQQVVNFAGTFNLLLVLALFLMVVIGEFSISIPYLLETIWILTGYHVVTGTVSPAQLIILMLVAITGRETGALIFYNLVRYGSTGIMRIYRRFFPPAPKDEASSNQSSNLISRVLSRVNILSPFSVAFGRLFYLRVPLTITLALKRRLATLLEAVVINSLIWDSIYILIGVIGGNAQVSELRLLLYSLGGFTVVYAVVFAVRRISGLRIFKR